MTDNTTMPPAIDHVALAQSLVASGKMTPAQANEALKAHGVTHAITDPAAPPHSGQVEPPDTLNPVTKLPGLKADQIQSAYDNWCKLGLDPQKFIEAANADGFSLEDDGRSEEEAEHDAKFGIADHDASEFKISYVNATAGQNIDVGAIAAFNGGATEWCSEMMLEPVLGGPIIERAMQEGQSFNKMSPSDQELYKRSERAIVDRALGGSEKTEEAITRVARVMKALVGQNEFTDHLVKSGALNNSWLFLTLNNHAMRLDQWNHTAPKPKAK